MFVQIMLMVKKSLRHYWVSTWITAVSVGLAAGLVMSVFMIKTQAQQSFTGGPFGFDAVLGARGSPLQLVLNSVFHLDTSPGNIPWSLYQEIKKDRRVALAIPYTVGDNYHGFRIVGTTQEIFEKLEYRQGFTFQMDQGRAFQPDQWETVIGSYVAQQERLKVGDQIHPFHGFVFDQQAQHAETYTVVGILEPTNTPADKVVWIPIDVFYRLGGHVLRGTGEEYVPGKEEMISDEHKEVSAVMLKLKNPQAGVHLDHLINKQGKVATLAWPIGAVMAQLFDKIGWINQVLSLIAYLVVIVAGGSILASVYNTINERRREFAIIRSLGARKRVVFSVIIAECAAIAGIGAALGYIVYFGILSLASWIIRAQTGVVLEVFQFHPVLVLTPLGMVMLGAVAGILPAYKAYATDVAANLVPTS
jgi:putative ABC transport system permease protein